MHIIVNVMLAIALIAHLTACGGGGSDRKSNIGGFLSSKKSPFTQNTVVLQDSSNLITSKLTQEKTISKPAIQSSKPAEACTIISDNYSTNGTCLYPVRVTGMADSVHLHKSNAVVMGGTRLLGVDEYNETPGSIFGGTDFDLSNPIELTTNNTLLDQFDAQELFDSISVDTAYYHIKFPLTYDGGTTTKWVTLHLAMYGQPFAESDAIANAKQDCGLSDEESTRSRFTDVDILADMRFERGDYLFCIKDAEEEVCNGSDFQWLDAATNALSSSRPNNPKRSHWLANNPVECRGGGDEHITFDFGPFGLFASIEQVGLFRLWSDFSHADLSRQWPNENNPFGDSSTTDDPDIAWIEPYFIYYSKQCENGSCDSVATQGSQLDVTLDFNTEQMLFIDNTSETDASAVTDIGELLANVHTRTQWGFDQKSMDSVVGFDVIDLSSMAVTPVISVSGGTAAPDAAIVYCADLASAGTEADGC